MRQAGSICRLGDDWRGWLELDDPVDRVITTAVYNAAYEQISEARQKEIEVLAKLVGREVANVLSRMFK